MKTNLLLTFLFFYSIHCMAQSHYVYMTSDGNHFSQKVLRTVDGGYLIAATQDCYTPGQTVIEGCINAILLQRLNVSEEVLWENEFSYIGGNSGATSLFEHEDGTFTMILGEKGNNTCNGLLLGFGIFARILIKNLDAQGNVIASTYIPESCERNFRDAIQLDDDRFAVLSHYREIGADPLYEGRLSIINRSGEILNEVVFPEINVSEGQLKLGDDGTVYAIYRDYPGKIELRSFDSTLSLIDSFSTNALETVYQMSGSKKTRIERTSNGEWIFLIHFLHVGLDNTYFFRLNSNLEVAAEAVYSLKSPTNIIQSPNEPNKYFFAATYINPDESKDTQIFEVDQDGNLNAGWILEAEGDEKPEFLMPHEAESFVLTGSVNCCNEPESVGPGYTFFLAGYSAVSPDDPSLWESRIQVTITAASEAVQLEIFEPALLNQSLNITIYDEAGQVIHVQDLLEVETFISLIDWAEGLYSYTIELNGELFKSGILVKI